MTRTINGEKFLMRDQRPMRELRAMHAAYCAKFGVVEFRRWLIERGKVYVTIRQSSR